MAPFLWLFGLVFASQVLPGFNTPLPPPLYGNRLSILSIDGGGIRGIIPASVLEYLDNALKAKDPTTSLAHYFDVISGTSTGGLMTTLLAAPNSSDTNHALLTPSQILDFYKEYGPEIFKPRPWYDLTKCPKYDGKFLEYIAGELLKELRLNQTLTNVVIPTFDERKIIPVIFSNYKLKTETYLNAKLSDICLGTSAAPTYLPSHQFQNDGVEFSLVDGALAANNPALVAVSEALQHNTQKEIMLLSVGTGEVKAEEKLSGIFEGACAAWWLLNSIGVVSEAVYSTNMIQYYLATVFSGLMPEENYLRIQEYDLDKSMEAMDNTETENLDNLEKVGKNLLLKKASRVNVNTFKPVELDQTNAEALDSFAEKLYEERQLRLKRKSMAKEGRPFVESVRVPLGQIRAT